MTKLSSVGVAIAFATMSLLAGCQLYFGSSGSGGGGGSGNASGGGGGSGGPDGNPPGFECNSDAQCAAGCFCSNGICAEAGFCATDKDCGTGFHCDVQRSSCVPNPKCTQNMQCTNGSVCDPTKGACVVTCACTSDAAAVQQGFGWCDEARNTCMTGTDPAGTCLGTVTCTTAAPKCPENQVALIKDGCFTGACRAIASCEAAPVCGSLQHEDDCLGRNTDCSTVYNGHGCHKPDGSACQAGDTNCKCDSFTFATCENKGQNANATRIVYGN
jgi:Cys-rich repeat protein